MLNSFNILLLIRMVGSMRVGMEELMEEMEMGMGMGGIVIRFLSLSPLFSLLSSQSPFLRHDGS